MKKILTLSIVALTSSLAAPASFDTPALLESIKRPVSRAEASYYPMVLDLDDGTTIDELEAQGITVWYSRGQMALAAVPRSLIQGAVLEGVSCASLGAVREVALDKAVPDTRANLVLNGDDGLDRAYNGAGVLVGLSDIGFDATHPAFTGRIVGFSNYNLAENAHTDLLAEGLVTDTDKQTHATHVTGIMAGDDPATVYRGVARGSEIYVTTSEALYDANILCGVEEIIAYGREHGMPIVINLSLGTTVGPHDGSGAFTRYLDLCAEDATILLSAGNDGNNPVSAHHSFSTESPTVSVGLNSTNYSDLMLFNGSIDIWGRTAAPVRLKIKMWNIADNRYDYSTDWISFDALPDEILRLSFDDDPDLSKWFTGAILAAGQVDPVNGRYNIGVSVDLKALVKHPAGDFSNIRPVFELTSATDTDVWVYAGGSIELSGSSYLAGLTAGSPERSISDMATGFKTICVGSATTRVTAPRADGGEYNWAGFVTLDEVSGFSAYGTLDDGRRLPDFCAPGAYIVAPANSAWVEAGYGRNLVPTDSPAPYMADCGTSMASPHAAGIIALWLQACPELTPAQLREIAEKTAVQRGVSITNPRTGAGLIDAVDGLRKALAVTEVTDPEVSLVRMWRQGSVLMVEELEPGIAVAAFDLLGRPVSLTSLPDSPVIVRVTSRGSTVVRKL